jgi:hypothetical protein
MNAENVDTSIAEREKQFATEIEQKLFGLPERYKDFYIELSLRKQSGATMEDVNYLNPFNFVSAIEVAEQINRKNQDESQADHWIPETYLWHWRQSQNIQDTKKEISMDAGIIVPYSQYQTEESIKTILYLMPMLVQFRNPLT